MSARYITKFNDALNTNNDKEEPLSFVKSDLLTAILLATNDIIKFFLFVFAKTSAFVVSKKQILVQSFMRTTTLLL